MKARTSLMTMAETQEASEPDLGLQFDDGDDGVLEVVYAAHGTLVHSNCRRKPDRGHAAASGLAARRGLEPMRRQPEGLDDAA